MIKVKGLGVGARDYTSDVYASTSPVVRYYQTRVISSSVSVVQTELGPDWGILPPLPILITDDINTHWIIEGFEVKLSKNVLFEVMFGFGDWDKLVEDVIYGGFTKPEDYYQDLIVKTYGYGKKTITIKSGYDYFVSDKRKSYWLPIVTGINREYLRINGLIFIRLPAGYEDVDFAITISSIWSGYI